MTDQNHYSVLSVSPSATKEEVKAAFEEVLAARRAKRASTFDVHAAYAVLGDPMLRRAYDMARLGRATSERVSQTTAQAAELAKDVLPEVNWAEVRQNAWVTGLKATVLISGATARAADITGAVSRRLQLVAARRLAREIILPRMAACIDDELARVDLEDLGEPAENE